MAEASVVEETFQNEPNEKEHIDRGLRRQVCIGFICIALILLAIGGTAVALVFFNGQGFGWTKEATDDASNNAVVSTADTPTRSPVRSTPLSESTGTSADEFLPETSSPSLSPVVAEPSRKPSSSTTSDDEATAQPSLGMITTDDEEATERPSVVEPMVGTKSPFNLTTAADEDEATILPSGGPLSSTSSATDGPTWSPTNADTMTVTGSPTQAPVPASATTQPAIASVAPTTPNPTPMPTTPSPTPMPTTVRPKSTPSPTSETNPPITDIPTQRPSEAPDIGANPTVQPTSTSTTAPSPPPAAAASPNSVSIQLNPPSQVASLEFTTAPVPQLMTLENVELLMLTRSTYQNMKSHVENISPRINVNGAEYTPFPCFATYCDPFMEAKMYDPIGLPPSDEWFLNDESDGDSIFGNSGLPFGTLELKVDVKDGEGYVWNIDASSWFEPQVNFETSPIRNIEGHGVLIKWKFDVVPA